MTKKILPEIESIMIVVNNPVGNYTNWAALKAYKLTMMKSLIMSVFDAKKKRQMSMLTQIITNSVELKHIYPGTAKSRNAAVLSDLPLYFKDNHVREMMELFKKIKEKPTEVKLKSEFLNKVDSISAILTLNNYIKTLQPTEEEQNLEAQERENGENPDTKPAKSQYLRRMAKGIGIAVGISALHRYSKGAISGALIRGATSLYGLHKWAKGDLTDAKAASSLGAISMLGSKGSRGNVARMGAAMALGTRGGNDLTRLGRAISSEAPARRNANPGVSQSSRSSNVNNVSNSTSNSTTNNVTNNSTPNHSASNSNSATSNSATSNSATSNSATSNSHPSSSSTNHSASNSTANSTSSTNSTVSPVSHEAALGNTNNFTSNKIKSALSPKKEQPVNTVAPSKTTSNYDKLADEMKLYGAARKSFIAKREREEKEGIVNPKFASMSSFPTAAKNAKQGSSPLVNDGQISQPSAQSTQNAQGIDETPSEEKKEAKDVQDKQISLLEQIEKNTRAKFGGEPQADGEKKPEGKKSVFSSIKNIFSGGGIKKMLGNTFNKIISTKMVGGLVKNIFGGISKVFSAGNTIKNLVTKSLGNIGNVFKPILSGVFKGIGKAFSGAGKMLAKLAMNVIPKLLLSAGVMLKGLGIALLAAVVGGLTYFATKWIMEGLTKMFPEAMKKFNDWIQEKIESVMSFFGMGNKKEGDKTGTESTPIPERKEKIDDSQAKDESTKGLIHSANEYIAKGKPIPKEMLAELKEKNIKIVDKNQAIAKKPENQTVAPSAPPVTETQKTVVPVTSEDGPMTDKDVEKMNVAPDGPMTDKDVEKMNVAPDGPMTDKDVEALKPRQPSAIAPPKKSGYIKPNKPNPAALTKESKTNVVNAPTTINNNTTTSETLFPRTADSSFNRIQDIKFGRLSFA